MQKKDLNLTPCFSQVFANDKRLCIAKRTPSSKWQSREAKTFDPSATIGDIFNCIKIVIRYNWMFYQIMYFAFSRYFGFFMTSRIASDSCSYVKVSGNNLIAVKKPNSSIDISSIIGAIHIWLHRKNITKINIPTPTSNTKKQNPCYGNIK